VSRPSEPEATPVRRLAEGVARREFLRRGGKWALAGTLAAFFVGTSEAEAQSPYCGTFSRCRCSGTRCFRVTGAPCRERYGDCPSGGKCWRRGYYRCCDYFCQHRACRCCKRVA
jgi:hypothetical protein